MPPKFLPRAVALLAVRSQPNLSESQFPYVSWEWQRVSYGIGRIKWNNLVKGLWKLWSSQSSSSWGYLRWAMTEVLKCSQMWNLSSSSTPSSSFSFSRSYNPAFSLSEVLFFLKQLSSQWFHRTPERVTFDMAWTSPRVGLVLWNCP